MYISSVPWPFVLMLVSYCSNKRGVTTEIKLLSWRVRATVASCIIQTWVFQAGSISTQFVKEKNGSYEATAIMNHNYCTNPRYPIQLWIIFPCTFNAAGLWLKTNPKARRVHLCYRSHLHTDKCQAALSDRRCTSLWYWREREAKKKEKKEDTERRHVLFMIAMWFKLSPLTLTPQLHPRIEFPGLSKSPHLRRSLYSHALPTARPSLPPPTNRFFPPSCVFLSPITNTLIHSSTLHPPPTSQTILNSCTGQHMCFQLSFLLWRSCLLLAFMRRDIYV